MPDPAAVTPASQTLSRGIRILEILAQARTGLSIDELARQLGVHRSIAYRLLRTLESHRLVVRDTSGLATLGPRLAALAAGVAHDLQAEALPELTGIANELGMTCFLSILDADECVTIVSVEPRHTIATVAQRPGTRHPVTHGAPGRAILSILPERSWPPVDASVRREIERVRADGFAVSHDEVIPGLQSLAVPLAIRNHPPAALAVVYVASPLGPAKLADRLRPSAVAITEAFE